MKAAGIDAQWIAADCGQEADIRRLADETLARLGSVDILVNNAGATWGAPAEDHPVAAWDKLMNLNVRGYFILSQHLAKLREAQMVDTRRESQTIFYRISDPDLEVLMAALYEAFCKDL